ncbi:MAG: HAMP domain-containing protein [Actinomycetota bacterium]|nr:HAMP domain-containing protein [Actinomycetota bacterium]
MKERRGERHSSIRTSRLGSFVLVKVIVALILALIISATLTSAVAARLTRSILGNETRALASGQMNILREAYAGRERDLAVQLRNLAQTFNAMGLYSPERRPELIAELGRASSNLDLALLQVLDVDGDELIPAAGAVDELVDDRVLPRSQSTAWSGGAGELHGQSTTLLLTKQGGYAQALWVGTLAGGRPLVLVGGYSFDDRFAYGLRKQIGDTGEVLLVVDGRVVGSTLTDPLERPPATEVGVLPSAPSVVMVDGEKRVVAYVPVGPADDPTEGAIGLLSTDPIAPLNRSLSEARLATIGLLTVVTLVIAGLLFRLLIRPLVRLARTARRIAGGDLEASFSAATHDEVGMLSRTLERMRLELRAKLHLVEKQATELQEISQRIVTAEDHERHRQASDLHDGIQQQLVVLRMRVALAAEGPLGHDPEVRDRFEQLGAELDAAIEQLREVTHNLYPSILLDRGLVAATRSYVARLPIYAKFTCDPEPFPRLSPGIENAAYFLLGEAVTNALKHASAGEVHIRFAIVDRSLMVTVRDDGRGFVSSEVDRRGGLLHMHDRVRSFGGELEIRSTPGTGTEVIATFPVEQPHTDLGGPSPDRPAVTISPRSSEGRAALPRPAG